MVAATRLCNREPKPEFMRTTLILRPDVGVGAPVVTGCPFPVSDGLGGPVGARIVGPEGVSVPAQVHTLLPQTPGGTKWLELSFFAPAAGEVEVHLEPESQDPPLGSAVLPSLILANSALNVVLSGDPTESPLRISWEGGSGSLVPELTVDGLIVRENPSAPRRLRFTRNGPLRSRAELEGQLSFADGRPSLSYRLSVEIWKNRSALRLDWMLIHAVPGHPKFEVSGAGLLGTWKLGGEETRVFLQPNHTAEFQPRLVNNEKPVTIIADDNGALPRILDRAMLNDDSAYPSYCLPAVGDVPPWLQVQGLTAGVLMTARDFSETRPNALVSVDEGLSFMMVPEGHLLTWPQGRRKEQNILLAFVSGSESDPTALLDLALEGFAHGHALPSPETLEERSCFEAGKVLRAVPGEHVRINRLLDSLCQLCTPAAKWDLGDTPDWHYTRIYGAESHQYFPAAGAGLPAKRFAAGGANGALFPPEVAYAMEPVWTNNEYDMIHGLAIELMRTGKLEHFSMLRWVARHNLEVDFVVYSDDPGHHRASPFHSFFHNTKGAITSHFWTQGLLEYYCLTGDDEAREVAVALGKKTLAINHSGASANWKFDREIGWALLSLTCLVEAGFEQFREEADALALFIRSYDRDGFNGVVNLSAGRPGRSLERQMIDCGFGYASMVEAMDRYQRITGESETGQWLERLLQALRNEVWAAVEDAEIPTARNMIGLVMAIGYERSGDEEFLLAGELTLEHFLDPACAGEEPFGGPGQLKPSAMLHRGLCLLSGYLAKTGRLEKYEYSAILRHRQLTKKLLSPDSF